MSESVDSAHVSHQSSPIDQHQDGGGHSENRFSEGNSYDSFLPPGRRKPKFPMRKCIRSHSCWRSNASFKRTKAQAAAHERIGADCDGLASAIGLIKKEWTFIQHLGCLSDLHGRSSCDTCQTIYQEIITLERSTWSRAMDMKDESKISCNIVAAQKKLFTNWSYVLYRAGSVHSHSLRIHWAPVGYYVGGTKALDPEWIDVQDTKGWIHECDDKHHECQADRARLSMPSRLSVIDVENKCVTEWEQDKPYLALSYVWGHTVSFELRLENHDELSQTQSLAHRWREIPQTIRDAILLTADLGFQYLWVDSLCIVQDDEENKFHDINQMASIYSCASIVIVAADGPEASHGLRGAGESPRRTTSQKFINFAPGYRVALQPADWSAASHKVYFSRGWTYQEYQLAPRLLVFFDDKVLWKCRKQEQSEEDWSLAKNSFFWVLPAHQITAKMTWPHMRTYADMVQDYNLRHTRDDNDVLVAFSGVLGAINHQFPAGFVQGLPEFYFDNALLWQPRMPLRRRVSNEKHHHLPSWSWIGWHGALDISHFSSANNAGTYATVQWSKTAGPGSSAVPIHNGYDIYRRLSVATSSNRRKDHDQPMEILASIRKEITDSGWRFSPNTYRGLCYHHPSLSGSFSYPVPISKGPNELQDAKLSYLRFKTNRAYLATGGRILSLRVFFENTCPSVHLVTKAGIVAGVLRLNSTIEDHSTGEAYECIAISRGQVNLGNPQLSALKFEEIESEDQLSSIETWQSQAYYQEDGNEWEWNDYTRFKWADDVFHPDDSSRQVREKIGIYEYYNIMWIEWEDGIAYRKAVGRVYREAWESLDLEEIDVLLG